MAKPRAVTPIGVLGDAPVAPKASEYLARVGGVDQDRTTPEAPPVIGEQEPTALKAAQPAVDESRGTEAESAIEVIPDDWFVCDSQVTSFRVPSNLLDAVRETATRDVKIGEILGAGILHMLELSVEDRAKTLERYQDLAFQGKRRARNQKG